MEVVIRASDFGGFDYCEEKWLAQRRGEIQFVSSPQIEEGARIHRMLDKQFLAELTEGFDFDGFIRSGKQGRVRPGAIGARLYAKFGDMKLAAIPDELLLDERGLTIIEDKNSHAAYAGYKNQARLYAFILQLLFPKELALKPTFCIIRQVSSLEQLWVEEYTAESTNLLISGLHKIRDVLLGYVKPVPCEHNPSCIPSRGDSGK